MSTEFDGQPYVWNEFLLQTPSGERATLVYEALEDGPQWKLFVSLAESSSISLDSVTALRVGDSLVLEGRSTRVTFTGNSVVAFAEGELPEGMAMGVVDQYLNTESGTMLYVICWRPGRLEVFRGMNLPTYAVESAFRVTLPTTRPAWTNSEEEDTTGATEGQPSLQWLANIAYAFIAIVFLFLLISNFSDRSRGTSRPIREEPAPAKALTLGGQWNSKELAGRVRAHAQAQIAKVGSLFQRHDYWLSTAESDSVWLIQGGGGNTDGWKRFTELPPPEGLRPIRAAEFKMGAPYSTDGKSFTITSLFRLSFRNVEGTPPEWVKADDVWMGFEGKSGDDQCVALWNRDEIHTFIGKKIPKP